MSIYRGLPPRSDDDDSELTAFATALRPRILRRLAPTSLQASTVSPSENTKDERAIVTIATEAIVALIAILALVISALSG